MFHHNVDASSANSTVWTVGEEHVWEAIDTEREICGWVWRPLVSEVYAIAAYDREWEAIRCIKSCCAYDDVKINMLSVFGLETVGSDAGNG